MRQRLVSLALLSIVSIAATSISPAAGATSSGPRVTMFGDSIADSLSYVPEARDILGAGIDLRLELTPCRKLVSPGCAYQGTHPPSVLDIVKASTPTALGDIVVVDVGYNEPPNDYDSDMGVVVDTLLSVGVAHVVWVTMREETPGYREINQVIRNRARLDPRIAIADWEAASRGKPWFNPDGLHLNGEGAIGLASFLRPYVLAACGSACAPRVPPTAAAPRNVRRPALKGAPVVGRVLRCSSGTWSGARPIVLSYRWLRNERVLPGRHEPSRALRTADRGRLVACRVWAANASGAASATSKAVRVRLR